jgi:hypothetical protein
MGDDDEAWQHEAVQSAYENPKGGAYGIICQGLSNSQIPHPHTLRKQVGLRIDSIRFDFADGGCRGLELGGLRGLGGLSDSSVR